MTSVCIDYEATLKYYEEWIAKNHPTHDRTSCSDDNLYNAGGVTVRYRCERCESLDQLRMYKLRHEYAEKVR